ncbi:hypothetical protein FOCG_18438 [Fusarium oxysporum f. sp. radicis-lycopersici 26381]|nr:hypothetical protein FOCG_18438 [Fusarium oxysporum f. sp. radicis-lycopersici 26381]
MAYIPQGNLRNQSDASTSTTPTPIFFGLVGGIIGVPLILIIFFIVKSRYHHPQPQGDIEAAKPVPKETVNLQTLNNANPSQKYEAVKGLKKQATWASTQSSSAEVCAICIEVLGDQDDVRRLKCKHVFHTSCIDSWFQKHHVDCPLCKSIFIPNRHGDPEDVR